MSVLFALNKLFEVRHYHVVFLLKVKLEEVKKASLILLKDSDEFVSMVRHGFVIEVDQGAHARDVDAIKLDLDWSLHFSRDTLKHHSPIWVSLIAWIAHCDVEVVE